MYRTHDTATGRDRIVKTAVSEYTTSKKCRSLLREYALLKSIDSANVIHVLGCEHLAGDRPALLLEDIAGVSLDRLLANGPMAWQSAADLALKIADALQDLHAQGIVHRDINPANIIWNASTGAVRLIDFSVAVRQTEGAADHANPDVIEGTLPYVSPEQTGRIGVALDHRTDFYSLGATLYELVTGAPPFRSGDAMELVHAHIARTPAPASAVNPAVPGAMAAIIAKLMAKRRRDRYQSAYGLKADLATVLESVATGTSLDAFVPGTADISSRFSVPPHLYGREAELEAILDACRRTRRGGFEAVLIAGHPGSGKTALVQAIQDPATGEGDAFTSGKFDPSTQNSPYHAIGTALTRLVSGVIGEGDASVRHLRERLRAGLGANGPIALQIVPDLEYVLGAQPPMADLPPEDARARTTLALRQLIRAFARDGRSLILFLDDLQWADAASLQFLAGVARAPVIANLLVIGAYRNNEVDDAHPLQDTLRALAETATVTRLDIAPLDKRHITRLIADTLCVDDASVADLAETCALKTLGNPFFLRQFLHALHGQRYIAFDARNGRWTWQSDRIAAAGFAENAIGLMAQRIRDLPQDTQDVLKIAACMGSCVDPWALSAACGRSPDDVAKVLADAVGDGLIVSSAAADTGPSRPASNPTPGEYRFVHDRVCEAAASLLGEGETTPTHLGIGRALLAKCDGAAIDDRIFQLVRHFNLAADLITTERERLAVAGLNLDASRKARAAGGFNAAYGYAQAGLALLPADAWDRHYRLALDLSVQAVVSAYLTHRHDWIDTGIAQVLANAHGHLDTTDVVQIQILKANAEGRLGDAVAIGLRYLEQLDIRFPTAPTGDDVGQRLRQVQDLLAGHTVEGLAALPAMTDPTARAAMQVFSALAGPAYNSSPALFLCMVFRQVGILLQYGNTPDAASTYSVYAMALCVVGNDFEMGSAFEELSLKLTEASGGDHFRARVNLNVNVFVHHWRHHLEETLAPLAAGYRAGREHGDLCFAALNAHVYCHHRLYTCQHLSDAEEAIAEQHHAIREAGQRHIQLWTEIFWQTTRNLLGEAECTQLLHGPIFDERDFDASHQDISDMTLIFLFHFNKLILGVLFDDPDQIREHLPRAEAYLPSVMGIFHVPMCRFYGFLGRLALLEAADGRDGEARAAMLATLRDHHGEMRTWAESAPMNHAHRYAVMSAELSRLDGAGDQAAESFDTAISLAEEHGYIWDLAVCQERAGRFYLARGRDRIAYLYLGDALRTYRRWGARAKVEHLQSAYRDLADRSRPRAKASGVTGVWHSGDIVQGHLDLRSVLKGSQAIAAEIVLDRLLDRMMRTVIENAGADRGLLLRVEGQGTIRVWAEARAGGDTCVHPHGAAPAPCAVLPLGIVNYAAATGRLVVLGDDTAGDIFAGDPYIVRHTPRSALCLPIKSRNRPIALIYLENAVTTNAFTPRHLEILEMLGGQIATSLENARLYEDLENRVAERTETLQGKVAELSRAYETVREAQRQLERQAIELRDARDAAEDANRSKSAFLASVSHELRSPLNAILGFSEILKDHVIDPISDETVRDYAGSIFESGEHLLQVINDLLDLAKIEAGRFEPNPEPLEVDVEIASCIRLVAQRAANHRLTLDYTGGRDLPYLTADRRALRQMMFNLLSNAIKFTPPGGSITVSSCPTPDGGLEIAVADTGIGIAPEDQAAVFEAFRRTKEAERRRIQGTGLGLPLVKSMIEAHGGRVVLTSKAGAGTRLALLFPPDAVGAWTVDDDVGLCRVAQ